MDFAYRKIGDTDLSVSTVGFGGAPLGGLFNAVDDNEAAATLRGAMDAGFRYVDTAPFYGFGRSERRVGDLLRGRDYVLSTKVGRILEPGPAKDPSALGWPAPLPFHPVFDYSYDGVWRSFEHSLQRLGLDRIDILYVHDIGEETHGAENAAHWNALKSGGYRALEEMRVSGLVKAIGLGVNESAVCLKALEIGDWDAFLLAGRYTLLEQAPLEDLLPACSQRGTSIVIGGPFNSGVLVGGTTWNYGAVPEDVRARVNSLRAHCEEFQVPLPAAALQFPLAHPSVSSVIPGLRSPGELADTLTWVNMDIPSEFWTTLKDKRLVHPEAPLPAENPFRD